MKRRVPAVLAVAAAALVAAAAAFAATVVVTPSQLDGWAVNNDTCGAATTGTVSFVTGPATPPAGTGSVQFTVGANGDSYPTVRQSGYNGVRLASVTALDYYTYVSHAGAGSQAPYLDVYVDNNGDGVRDDILTFEPVYQTSQGTVTPNTWQHWDAVNGLWWSDSMGGPPPLFTLSSYVASHPTSTILNVDGGGVILAAGCGGAAWANFAGNADKLTIGVNGSNTTYDFEPAAVTPPPTSGPPTSKDQCKNGGWKSFTNPSFKNQGQCVAFVNHHNGKGADDDDQGQDQDQGSQGHGDHGHGHSGKHGKKH
jgi:hypothetical protein